jgi:uncharacterized protein YggE
MRRHIALLSIAGLLLLALLGAACGADKITVANQQAQSLGISVSGEGKVSGAPDVAVLTLGVSALAPSVKDARDQAATAMNGVVDSIKGNGVDAKDIQSTQFSIQPEYNYRDNNQELSGYRVTNIVTAKVRDIDNTSKVIDDAVAAGGDLTQIQGIDFTIDDPSKLQDEARAEAVKDAQTKAERLADLAGVKLGKPLSISESSASPPLGANFGVGVAQGAAVPAPSPIEPGQLEVTLDIQVLYAIE